MKQTPALGALSLEAAKEGFFGRKDGPGALATNDSPKGGGLEEFQKELEAFREERRSWSSALRDSSTMLFQTSRWKIAGENWLDCWINSCRI
jgi:hypothetical protein